MRRSGAGPVWCDDGCARWLRESGDLGERRRVPVTQRVEVGDDVGVFERGEGGGAHHFLQLVLGIEESRGVREDELRVGRGDEADHGEARGLGFR